MPQELDPGWEEGGFYAARPVAWENEKGKT